MANRNKNQVNKKRSNYRNKARKDAKRGNYQDAFADEQKAKLVPVDTKSHDNDAAWYNPHNQMIKDVASFNFGYPTGKPLMVKRPDPESNTTVEPVYDPGVMVMTYLPTLGRANSPSDPLNTAANQLYQNVRSKTTIKSDYEAPNLAVMTISVASAYAFYVWMTRIYGSMNSFDVLNRYTPQALIQAMNVNYLDIQSNLNDFRTYINQFAYRLSSLAVPQDMNIFKRWIFMNESIYMDSSSPRAQYYMYNPAGFWLYNETPSEETLTTTLSMKTFNANVQLTYSAIRNFGEALLAPLFQSDDVRQMTSDLLKAYGEGGIMKALPIAETYKISPVYSAEVLSQMENATVMPHLNYAPIQGVPSNITFTITENTTINNSYLITNYHYVSNIPSFGKLEDLMNQVYNTSNDIVNFHGMEEASPDQMMVATRLKLINSVTFSSVGGSTPFLNVTFTGDIGSEVIVGSDFYVLDENGAVKQLTNVAALNAFNLSSLNNATVGLLIDRINILSQLSKFDWHPKVQLGFGYTVGSSTNAYLSDIFYDIDCFTYVSDAELQNMHYTALFGLLVPKSVS